MERKPNQINFASPNLQFFSEDQLEEIHLKTLELLECVGVLIDKPEAVDLLKGAGAYVREDRVRIPSWLVEEAIRTAPPRIVLANREGERDLFLEKNQPYFGLGSDLPYTIDHETGERRDSQKEDVVNASMVAEQLENIDFMMSMAIAKDTPEKISDIHQFEAMMLNTTMPIVTTAHNEENLRRIIELSEILRGGEQALKENPYFACYAEPISPLRHAPEGTSKLLACSEKSIPILYTPAVMGGAASPVTLAGSVVIANAELLSGLVIHQLKNKGAPFIYGGAATIMDMKTTVASYGAPELHMNSVVLTQLSQKYELPMFSTGGCTDSCVLDNQASIEATYSLFVAGLSGANLIHDVGYIDSGLTQSLTSMVINNETIAMVKRFIRGYEVNSETVPLDLIADVGPGGEFLTEEHTAKFFKEAHWTPELLSRDNHNIWQDKGAKTMKERAERVVTNILSQDENPAALKGKKREKIKSYMQELEKMTRDSCE